MLCKPLTLMKKTILFLGWILLSAPLHAQQFVLSGSVLDTKNHPLSGVSVYIDGTTLHSHTDSAGRFHFSGLTERNYQLLAVKPGFRNSKLSVNVNGHIHIRMIMSPLKEQLEEVVVKDRRLEIRKQEESLNVETVSNDYIHRNLGGSLMESLKRLPGIKTIGIGSGQSKPLIRGLGFNRVVVIDKGVKHEEQQWGADHGLELDQFAAGEVELIKGAASFIYGSDAIAGVIDVKSTSVPAAHSLGGSVDLTGKSNNNLYGGSVNLYGRNERWFFDSRFTGLNYGDYKVPASTLYIYDYAVKLHNNQLRNTAGKENGIHFSSGYLGNRFRSVFYMSNSYSKSGFFANARGLEPRRVDETLHDNSDRDIQLPGQKVRHLKLINKSSLNLGSSKLEAELGYQHNSREEYSHYIGHGYMPPAYPDTMQIPQHLERRYDKHVYSLNLRTQFQAGAHTITVGGNGEYQDNEIGGWGFLAPSFNQIMTGVFVYDKLRLNEKLLLHGALRYDHGNLHIFPYADWFPSGSPGEKLVRAEDMKRSINSLVWSGGLNYNTESGFNMKVNVGRSFRMAIAKELAANGVNYDYFSYEKGNAGLSPEKSYQVDLSTGWTNDKWTVQLSPFFNYFPNYIYLNPTSEFDHANGAGNQIFRYAQSRVRRYGGEVQLKYKVSRTLAAEMLGEYLHSKQLSGDKKGYTLPFSPPPSILFNLTYSPDINDCLRDTYFSIDYRLTAEQNNIVPPERKTARYKVVDVQTGTRIHLYHQPVIVSLQVQNLFNTRYLVHTSFYRLIGLPEAGRNFVLSVRTPFGKKTQN